MEKKAIRDERGSMPARACDELVANRLDLRRVRRIVDIDPAGAQLAGLADADQLVERGHLTGHHDR